MNARGIAVATNLTIAACVLMFTIVVHSGRAGGLALPVFIAVVVLVATAGVVTALRVGRRRPRER